MDQGLYEAKSAHYVEFSGAGYYITEKGYDFLMRERLSRNTKQLKEIMQEFKESTSNSNTEMLKHTKILKWITIVMLIGTVVNLILFLVFR